MKKFSKGSGNTLLIGGVILVAIAVYLMSSMSEGFQASRGSAAVKAAVAAVAGSSGVKAAVKSVVPTGVSAYNTCSNTLKCQEGTHCTAVSSPGG